MLRLLEQDFLNSLMDKCVHTVLQEGDNSRDSHDRGDLRNVSRSNSVSVNNARMKDKMTRFSQERGPDIQTSPVALKAEIVAPALPDATAACVQSVISLSSPPDTGDLLELNPKAPKAEIDASALPDAEAACVQSVISLSSPPDTGDLLALNQPIDVSDLICWSRKTCSQWPLFLCWWQKLPSHTPPPPAPHTHTQTVRCQVAGSIKLLRGFVFVCIIAIDPLNHLQSNVACWCGIKALPGVAFPIRHN